MSLGESDYTHARAHTHTCTHTCAHTHTWSLKLRKVVKHWILLIYGAACTALSKTAWQAGTPLPEIPLLTRPGPASEQKQWCGVYKSLIRYRAVTAFPVLVGELLSTTGVWGLELAAEKCTPSFSEQKIPSQPCALSSHLPQVWKPQCVLQFIQQYS